MLNYSYLQDIYPIVAQFPEFCEALFENKNFPNDLLGSSLIVYSPESAGHDSLEFAGTFLSLHGYNFNIPKTEITRMIITLGQRKTRVSVWMTCTFKDGERIRKIKMVRSGVSCKCPTDIPNRVTGFVTAMNRLTEKLKQLEDELRKYLSRKVSPVLAVDFDNTLFYTQYPRVLDVNESVAEYVRKKKVDGYKIIITTCRHSSTDLQVVRSCCESFNIPFDYINENLPEQIELWGDSRKIWCTELVDDTCKMTVEKIKRDYEKRQAITSSQNNGEG